jgi:hypothetical protein
MGCLEQRMLIYKTFASMQCGRSHQIFVKGIAHQLTHQQCSVKEQYTELLQVSARLQKAMF